MVRSMSQRHEIYCQDLEVICSNPSRLELEANDIAV